MEAEREEEEGGEEEEEEESPKELEPEEEEMAMAGEGLDFSVLLALGRRWIGSFTFYEEPVAETLRLPW